MAALGKGLASLIPKRNSDSAEDVLERIDSMENVVEESVEEPAQQKSVGIVEDFDESENEDRLAPPVKPLVTPITLDPTAPKTRRLKVEEEAEDDLILDDAIEEEPEEEKTEVAPEELPEEEPEEAAPDPEDLQGEDIEVDESNEAEEVEVAQKHTPEPVAPRVEEQEEDVPTPGFGEAGASIWDKHEEKIVHIALGDIDINPLQPRRSFDPAELEELKESIEMHGILQPLVVRRLSDDRGYELIAGERRLRAAKALNWDRVPCVVRRDVKSDQSRLVYALIENIQRENLNPVEEAMAYQQLNEEYGLTHEEIGERVGRSRVGITNIVRLLQLPAEIQRGLVEGKISIGHAKAILMIPDEEKQVRFYQHLLDEGLTVRKAETRARRIQRTMKINDPMRKKTRNRHPLALKYSPVLEERYGYDSYVKFDEAKNRFEVVFKAYSEKEIEELMGRLLGTSDLPDPEQDSDVLED